MNINSRNFESQEPLVQPGVEDAMNVKPIFWDEGYSKQPKKLNDKVAIITGGDSGIGRAIALSFVREGAKVVINYLNEDVDAQYTKELIDKMGGQAILIKGDIGKEELSKEIVTKTIDTFGKLNIIVNNAGVQYPVDKIEDLKTEQLMLTFNTNIFGPIYLIREGAKYLNKGDCIINTTSITAYKGHETLIDYSATKGALVALTRSLSLKFATKGIRVNAVAPGPIWTPLIPSSFKKEKYKTFGNSTAFKRAGEPVEVAEAYVFLASDSSSFITGETIHVNGGEFVSN